MTGEFIYTVLCLLFGIAIIVLLTTKYRIHAFFALILAAFVVGLGIQLPLATVITTIKEGFGNVLKNLALIIVLGTTLGILLEFTGSTRVMANYIIKKVGEKRSALAISITGFVVGLPIFCDSGYIVLSGLTNSLSKKTGIHIAVMATSLATSLYAVHCLVPPHPGITAAAGIIPVDFGKLILLGLVVAIPATIVGHLWARFASRNLVSQEDIAGEVEEVNTKLPSAIKAFLPVVVPIFLIGLKAFLPLESLKGTFWFDLINSLGDPVIALAIGVLLAFNCMSKWNKESIKDLMQESGEKAGNILLIIGAGGAFGAILAQAKVGEQLGAVLPLASLGLLFPFLIAFIMKTAQGSSTVAIITSASIVLPLLPGLGLARPNGHLLAILAMGAGSMTISHANDSYFWVISKFSNLEMRTMLRVYSLATVLMGIFSLIVVYIMSFILL